MSTQKRTYKKIEVSRLYDIIPSKAKKGKCIIRGCRNKSVSGSNLCSKHKHQRRKANDPVGYFFDISKQNAKNRGLEFSITKEYFKSLVDQTDYLKRGGMSNSSLTLDRIDNSKGYVKGNVQVITFEENREKGADAPF